MFTLDIIPWGYNFNQAQLDGTQAVTCKMRFGELRTLHVLHLAQQRGLADKIIVQDMGSEVRLGFITASFMDPICQFFSEQALITKINKEASKRKPDVHDLAAKFRDLFDPYRN
jgi:hypothetical protein